MVIATYILLAVMAYSAAGVVLGFSFICCGAGRVDSAAQLAHWPFRLIILPGVIALWPLVAMRWHAAVKGSGTP